LFQTKPVFFKARSKKFLNSVRLFLNAVQLEEWIVDLENGWFKLRSNVFAASLETKEDKVIVSIYNVLKNIISKKNSGLNALALTAFFFVAWIGFKLARVHLKCLS